VNHLFCQQVGQPQHQQSDNEHAAHLARFALLTPEPNYSERPALPMSPAPLALAERLKRLHEQLPEPPPLSQGSAAHHEQGCHADRAWPLSADIWSACRAYEQALRAMTAPGSTLDDRLRATYGRLHVQAIKVALLLAALDWSDGVDSTPRPHVTLAHWCRAQEVVEGWRASAHRLLADLGETEESRLEERILRFLRARGGMRHRTRRLPRPASLPQNRSRCAQRAGRRRPGCARAARLQRPRPSTRKIRAH
jgi:hypothetical protein